MTTSPFASLLRPELANLHAYQPNPGEFAVRLDANESPPLLSPEAREKLDRAVVPAAWNRYPDARVTDLRHAIASHCDASPDEVLVGDGSDEVIAMLLTALARPRDRAPMATIVTTTPTFVMYSMSARVRGMNVLEVPLDAQWDLDVTGLCRAIEMGRPNIVFISTPNNPTGGLMSLDRLQAVVEAASDALVVVDEAYIDFARRNQVSLLRNYPNVAILRTLSKIGFAALRLGWMIGPAELVREVDKVRQPYNISVPTQAAALVVLRDLGPEIAHTRATVIAERERLATGLRALGFVPAPSEANFLWVKTTRPAQEVVETLASRSILIKSFHPRGGRLLHHVRITVGLPAENDRLLQEIFRVRVTRLLISLGPLPVALAALAGCIQPTVIRVVDGQPIEGRYISEYAYMLYAYAADAEARGDVSGALESYEAALDQDPNSPEIWTRIGALRCRLAGTIREADDAFHRAQSLDPDYEPLFREWAACSAAEGHLDHARNLATHAVTLDPERDGTAILYASILEKLGRKDEAKRQLDALTVWHPSSAEAWSARYAFAQRHADPAGAAHAASKLRALAPSLADRLEKDIPSLTPLAEVDLALQQGDLARARRKAITARLPAAELAIRAAALGRTGPALEQAELVLGADPESTSARVALAVAADLTRDDATLQRALDLPPSGPLTPASPIARLLFAELLDRRVGREASLAWLGPLDRVKPSNGADPLLIAVHRRVAARLGTN